MAPLRWKKSWQAKPALCHIPNTELNAG
jgi:hypothetical protein